jgi:hypothetical protein
MPKGFDLRCAAGKTARVWKQGKGGGLKPGQAFVLLPKKMEEGADAAAGYLSPLRTALIDRNHGNVNVGCVRAITARSSGGLSIWGRGCSSARILECQCTKNGCGVHHGSWKALTSCAALMRGDFRVG